MTKQRSKRVRKKCRDCDGSGYVRYEMLRTTHCFTCNPPNQPIPKPRKAKRKWP